jgi:hypothetical protein
MPRSMTGDRLRVLSRHVSGAEPADRGYRSELGDRHDFVREYNEAAAHLIRLLHDDADALAGVAARCVDTLRAGSRVFCNYLEGHMPDHEIADSREVRPQLPGAQHAAL